MLLPELISDILLSLPVKTLLRFRCLSKSICAEVDSAEFTKSHLSKSVESKTHQKLIILDLKAPTDVYAADLDDGGLEEATVLRNPLQSPVTRTLLLGSLNGLILLGIYVKSAVQLALWNPFTRRYKYIPSCPAQCHSIHNNCGLGYDSALDDYKIVMFSEGYDFFKNCFSFEAWVFRLKSNSWRRIQDPPLSFDIGNSIVGDLDPKTGSSTNCPLYWARSDHNILGFDIANEVFFILPLGSGFNQGVNFHYPWVVLDGNIFTTRVPAELRIQEFFFPVGDEGGEEADGGWRKAFLLAEEKLIEFDNYPSGPLTYSDEGDSILFYEKNELFWYNSDKESRQRVEIAGIPHAQRYIYNVCCESLVCLGDNSAFDGAAEEVVVDEINEVLHQIYVLNLF